MEALILENLKEPLLRLVIVGLDQAEVTMLPILRHGLPDDDLEIDLPVFPTADVAAVDSDDDRPFRDRRNVSTSLRQPAFEFKLGFAAFGLAG